MALDLPWVLEAGMSVIHIKMALLSSRLRLSRSSSVCCNSSSNTHAQCSPLLGSNTASNRRFMLVDSGTYGKKYVLIEVKTIFDRRLPSECEK
jgi:hypothetical protein